MTMINAKQLLNSIITVIVGVILLVAVALPIVLDVVANTTATGTTLLILGFLGVFIAIATLVLVISLIQQ